MRIVLDLTVAVGLIAEEYVLKPSISTLRLCMVATVLWPALSTFAQEPTARERQLEELVHKLSAKVEQLEARLDKLEDTAGNRATEARVAQLEENIEQIKKEGPPAPDSREWARIREWASNDLSLQPYWKEGLRLDSFDGSVKLKIGGRIQHDTAYFIEGDRIERRIGAQFDDNSEFRRTRLYLSGVIYDNIEFKTEFDFAGGDADFKDVYVGFKNVPHVGNVRIGQFKEPFSLEELTSSNDITFLERSLVNTLVPRRNTGIMFHDTMLDKRMTWAAGIFRQTDSFGDGLGGRDYNVTARLTGLPLYEDDGRKLIHLGVAYTHQNYEGDTYRLRARPESHLAPRVVDTGVFSAEYGDIIIAEAAIVDGPLSLQAEYVHALIESRSRFIDDPNFWAASVQASYFLTGEHRPYKTSSGAFDRVRPLCNFTWGSGGGAWELAARYSYLTLNDHNIHGGRLVDLTLGVNWYLNPNLRIMWNYVWADASHRFRDGVESNAFQWRVQLAF